MQLLLSVIAGLSFGIAPLLGRYAPVNAMMMAVLIAGGSLAAVLPVAFLQNYAAAGSRALMINFAAGIANGIGLLVFYYLVARANEGLWEISRVAPIVFGLVPVIVAIGAWVFFDEALTRDKFIGIVLVCGAIWFLK